MKKALVRYLLTLAMGLLAIVLTVSSFLLWVVLPSGFFPSRLLWIAIHKWVGLALTVLVFVHVLVHLRWIARTTRWIVSGRRSSTAPARKGQGIDGSSDADLG